MSLHLRLLVVWLEELAGVGWQELEVVGREYGFGVHEMAKGVKILLQEQGITEVRETASQDRRLQRAVERALSGRTGEMCRKERGARE